MNTTWVANDVKTQNDRQIRSTGLIFAILFLILCTCQVTVSLSSDVTGSVLIRDSSIGILTTYWATSPKTGKVSWGNFRALETRLTSVYDRNQEKGYVISKIVLSRQAWVANERFQIMFFRKRLLDAIAVNPLDILRNGRQAYQEGGVIL
ncbi:uncharacterized protein EI90DRAFT_340175 [Cantharellus anzutake]|uniref:uncharacterized protein n=1 Tax=Cantharellus anzutake TaxID=1750568 RepID=UPI0019087DE5|nr:uncharacterized protein EI90DRAFT_340175 [Cantharellus anzutake]KAF8315543.1 hypothetical protein EI90DRAFT_340175 [Cantharellus anzutake]